MKSRIEKKVFGIFGVLPFMLCLVNIILSFSSMWGNNQTFNAIDIALEPINAVKSCIPTNWFTLIHNILNAFNITDFTYFDIIITMFMWCLFSYILYMAYIILSFIPHWIVKRFDYD